MQLLPSKPASEVGTAGGYGKQGCITCYDDEQFKKLKE